MDPLQNAIHPLFTKERWATRYGDETWETLDPVLKLASRFISEDAFMPFFFNLIFGRRDLPETLAESGHPLQCFSVDTPLDKESVELTKSWLQTLGSKNSPITLEFGTRAVPGFVLYGSSQTYPDVYRTFAGFFRNPSFSWSKVSLIRLNLGYLDDLCDHDKGVRRLSRFEISSLRLKMAMTMIHELCHSIYRLLSSNPYEPYFMDQQTSELGRAWECWMFGGQIGPYGIYDCRDGLTFADWPGISKDPVSERSREPAPWRRPPADSMITWVVPAEYIFKVQTEGFWKGEVVTQGVNAVRMPKVYGWRSYWSPGIDQIKTEEIEGSIE